MNVDVTITACRRSKILEQTLHSFWQNLLYPTDHEYRAIINVDPIGIDKSSDDIIILCHKYFDEVFCRTPIVPDFSSAFIWTWSQIKTKYFIHLEDDWELLHTIDFNYIIKLLEADPELALLRLPQFKSVGNKMKNWNKFFDFNGLYYECPKELKRGVGFCGHPSIIKKEFADAVLPYMKTGYNPEKQLHGHGCREILEEIDKWEYGVFSVPDSPPAIRDIGRGWMTENGFIKEGSKAFFLRWQEVD
jgi:hypothetical protein